MKNPQMDPRAPVDVHVDSPGREGLTGTAPASLYVRTIDREQITIPPNLDPSAAQPAWRRDFPIDWSADHDVERRDFTRFMVLTSFALAAGQVWIAARSWWAGRQPPPGGLRIASVNAVAVGGVVVFTYPGEHDSCVLVRLNATDFVAYSQKCTHLSCAVVPRPEQGILHCPCHNGFFDLRSGRPTAGPPSRPLPRIQLAVRDGEIYAVGVEPGAA